MNDRVITVEKKASNKVVVLIIIVIIFAVLGFGAYYYITNKNSISFDFKLPWQKEDKKEKEEEATIEVDGQKISKKVKTEKKLERQAINIEQNKPFIEDDTVTIEVESIELKEEAYQIKLKMSNKGTDNYVMKVKAIAVDGCQMNQSFTLQTTPGGEAIYDLVLPAQELDKNRIGTFTELKLISDITTLGKTETKDMTFDFNEYGTAPDIDPIATIDLVDKKMEIKYYKKEETSNSTKLYFLFSNTGSTVYTYYIARLAVNDEEIDASAYKDTIYGGVKYISVIELPKKFLSSNKNIKISFLFQTEDKSIFKTVEKEIKI